MKKTRILIAALVCAVLLMGVGYAYWTDAITFTGTVETGSMDVRWIEVNGIDGIYPYVNEPTNPVDMAPVIDATVTHGDKVTTFYLGNLFPGAWATFDLKAKNTGSIPVKFDTADVTFANADPELLAVLQVKASVEWIDTDGVTVIDTFSTGFVNIQDLKAALDTRLAGLILQPGQYLCFDGPTPEDCIRFTIPTTVTNADNVEDKSAEVSIRFNWKQFNQ